MKHLRIAIIAHLAIASLSAFAGESDVVNEFEALPDAKKEALISGVSMLLENPEAGHDARHNAWVAEMLEAGWVYGKKKDDEAKTHPRIVDFEKLNKLEREKEILLHAIVRAMANDPVADSAQSTPNTALAVPAGSVPIKYVGMKDEHTDTKYGTKLVWSPGQVHYVPAASAAKMLKHTDTYAQDGDAVSGVSEIGNQSAAKNEKTKIPLPHLEGMDKNELISFAQQHYGEILEPDMAVEDMRGRILGVIHSRGR